LHGTAPVNQRPSKLRRKNDIGSAVIIVAYRGRHGYTATFIWAAFRFKLRRAERFASLIIP
jgi:hypothetical protein